jgi:spermidine/putrescine-binding protein
MFFIKRLILTSCMVAFQFKAYCSFKPTINVLTYMHTLDPALVAKFEEANNANVRVDFVGSRNAFEAQFRAGLRTYDVLVADERILEKLYLSKLIRTLPNESASKNNINFPLFQRSKVNEDGLSYLPLFADPLVIAFNTKNSKVTQPVTWDILIHIDENPYWRQRIFVSPSYKSQFLIALLATQTIITPQSWYIPESTTRWFKQLRLQNANTDLPLELAFLGNKISAAVVFYSDYLRLKRVISNLDFVIPTSSTYYDRISVGWGANSVQENLSKNFIKYIYDNREHLSKNLNMLSLNSTNFKNSETKNWILYEDDIPLPKKIENILKDLSQTPNNPSL